MSRKRILPVALVLVLSVSGVVACGATARAHAERSHAQAVAQREVPRTGVPARAAIVPPFVRTLLRHIVHKARPIVSNYVKRRVRRLAWEWTKWEAVQWYCGRWDAYFGYNRRTWYLAAHYYYGPNWAWRLCREWRYFG